MNFIADKQKIELNQEESLYLGVWDLLYWQNNKHDNATNEDVANKLSDMAKEDFDKLLLKAGEFADKEGVEKFLKALSCRSYTLACMVGEELLENDYQIVESKGKVDVKVLKREKSKPFLKSYMLSYVFMETIYENASRYYSFEKLYLDAYNLASTKNCQVNFKNINTFGKGSWKEFLSEESDPENFDQNCELLKNLAGDIMFENTKSMFLTYENGSNMYLFSDDDGTVKLLIIVDDGKVTDVCHRNPDYAIDGEYKRFIQMLNEQGRLYTEYCAQRNRLVNIDVRDVAIEFLTKNPQLKNTQEWIEKEDWYSSLNKIRIKIEQNNFKKEDVKDFVELMNMNGYVYSHADKFFVKNLISKNVSKLQTPFDEYFGGRVHLGDIKTLGYIVYEVIVGDVDFAGVSFFDNLTLIIGNAKFKNSFVKSLGKIKEITGELDLEESNIEDLGELEVVGGDLYLNYANLSSLGNLKRVGRFLGMHKCTAKSMPNLEYVGSSLKLIDCGIESLENLKYVGGELKIENSKISNLGKLEHVGSLSITNSTISDFGKIKELEELWLTNSNTQSLEGLTKITKRLCISHSSTKSMGSTLTEIGDYCSLYDSEVSDFGAIKKIGGELSLTDCPVTDLKNLEYCKFIRIDKQTKLTAPNLKYCDGVNYDVYCDNNQLSVSWDEYQKTHK